MFKGSLQPRGWFVSAAARVHAPATGLNRQFLRDADHRRRGRNGCGAVTRYYRADCSEPEEQPAGQVEDSAARRAAARARIQARFAGSSPRPGGKRNTESRSLGASRSTAPPAAWAALQSLESARRTDRKRPLERDPSPADCAWPATLVAWPRVAGSPWPPSR